jgi:hypothetical protein
MLVYHTTSLRLDSNPPLSFNVQFIEDLLIATRRNRARQLKQSITERALPMINVCHYTEVPKSFNWNSLNPALKLGKRLLSLSASCYRRAKKSRLCEELRRTLGSYGAREPEELQWASLHLSS